MGIEANLWRQETPGNNGWSHSARPDAANKYLMVSCDTHMNEPHDVWAKELPPELAARLPRIEVDEHGQKWEIVPGMRPIKAIYGDEGDAEDHERVASARSPEQAVKDMDRDGVDVQIAFPNKGLITFAIGDPAAMYPLARIYNDWLVSNFASVKDRILPMALIPTVDIDLAIKEIDRVAKTGFFRGLMLPGKAKFGPYNASDPAYNQLAYDRLWEKIQEVNLTMTFHVATTYDTRAVRGPGAAVTCYAAHSHPGTIEVVSHLCASGIIERFPKLRFATIEAGIGFLPWTLAAMDEAYKKHHLWIKHKLKNLPSEYFYENGFSAFMEDAAGLQMIDPRVPDGLYRRLENCYLWSNDYPHHEGTWPHSAQAIERQMQHLTDDQRAKILGLNAVRCFDIQDLADKRKVKKS